MTATATRVSPWLENLRHMYEAGRSIETMAYWYSVPFYKMRHWLALAGTTFRRGGTKPRPITVERNFEDETAEARAVVFSERAGII